MHNKWFLSDKFGFDSKLFTTFSRAAMALNLIRNQKKLDDQPDILELQKHLRHVREIIQKLLEYCQMQKEAGLTRSSEKINYSQIAIKLIKESTEENALDNLEEKLRVACKALLQLEKPDKRNLDRTISFFYEIAEIVKAEIEQESELFNI